MSAANGGVGLSVELLHFQPDVPEVFFDGFDLRRAVMSGPSVEPDNTNGSKSNHQHKEASGVRLKCAT